jgi:hypothetical protein
MSLSIAKECGAVLPGEKLEGVVVDDYGAVFPTARHLAAYEERIRADERKRFAERDGFRTSADGLTRMRIAPDAAAPLVPCQSVEVRLPIFRAPQEGS